MSFERWYSSYCVFDAFSGGVWLRNFDTSAMACSYFGRRCGWVLISYRYFVIVYSNACSSSSSMRFVSCRNFSFREHLISRKRAIRSRSCSCVINSSSRYGRLSICADSRENTTSLVANSATPRSSKVSCGSFVCPRNEKQLSM